MSDAKQLKNIQRYEFTIPTKESTSNMHEDTGLFVQPSIKSFASECTFSYRIAYILCIVLFCSLLCPTSYTAYQFQ